MKQKNVSALLLTAVLAVVSFPADAQTKKRKPPAKKAAVATIKPTTTAVSAEMPAKLPPKKNGRPEDSVEKSATAPQQKSTASNAALPTYFYEFTQPDFLIERILIEHDEVGKGKLSFMKKGYSELISDPLEVSPIVLERINTALAALNFLDSNEIYQYEKDFAHLGTIKFKLEKAGRARNTTFNWTQNKDAKTLADEYRRLGNQFIWIFDVSVARENQPLETPKLMDSLESLIKRNEISDSKQMIPFLQGMANDERIPLIARNHAGKLITLIGKEKK